MSDSLQPHELQHTRLPCPSPSPGVCSNSCPLSRRCHPTISSFVAPFSLCPPSFPASGSFPVSWFFASGGQSIWALASASVLPMNIQGWSPKGLLRWQTLGIIMSQSTHHGPMRLISSFNYPADEEAETWRNYPPPKVTKLEFEPIYLHSDLDLFHCLPLKNRDKSNTW